MNEYKISADVMSHMRRYRGRLNGWFSVFIMISKGPYTTSHSHTRRPVARSCSSVENRSRFDLGVNNRTESSTSFSWTNGPHAFSTMDLFTDRLMHIAHKNWKEYHKLQSDPPAMQLSGVKVHMCTGPLTERFKFSICNLYSDAIQNMYCLIFLIKSMVYTV